MQAGRPGGIHPAWMRPGAQRARRGKNLPGLTVPCVPAGREPWSRSRESEPTAAATVAIGPHIVTPGRFGTIGRPRSAKAAGKAP